MKKPIIKNVPSRATQKKKNNKHSNIFGEKKWLQGLDITPATGYRIVDLVVPVYIDVD